MTTTGNMSRRERDHEDYLRRSRYRHRKRQRETLRVPASEVLGMGPEATDPAEYAVAFRTALRLAIAEAARTDSPEVARSRAALLTVRSAAGLSLEDAERVRSRVFREECEERGVEPVSGGVVPGMYGAEPGRHEDVLRVPRGRALDGERPRRGGKR
ncbi:hypothetical protein [Nocardioides sp. GXQ0305]|uniref:hypothetical protein n=1 Tax=Nocardioides sp. GXQ0305 TaxID=3423912 RepID=UPI003D7D7547